MADRLWKVLDGTTPVHGGTGRYPGKGRWTRHIDEPLVACHVGYHFARGVQLLSWLPFLDEFTVWTVDPCPDHPMVDAGDKWVACRVRLGTPHRVGPFDLRMFAADAAEAALLGERASGREPDARSWAAVEAARLFADGALDLGGLNAAGAAARDARDARAAADAAWAAADAAEAAAEAAAWAAARVVAWAAAGAAAGAAAEAAARDALYDRFTARITGRPLPPVAPLYGPKAVAS